MLARPFEAVFRQVNKAADRTPHRRAGRASPSPGPPRGLRAAAPGTAGVSGRAGQAPPRAGQGSGTAGSTRTPSPAGPHLPPSRAGHPAGPAGAAARCRPALALRKRRGALPRLPSQPLALRSGCLPAGPRPPSEEEPGQEKRKGRESGRERNPAAAGARSPGKGSAPGGTQALSGTGSREVPASLLSFPRSRRARP